MLPRHGQRAVAVASARYTFGQASARTIKVKLTRAGRRILVTDGIERATKEAETIAGDGAIALGSPSIIQQCLNLGIVDRIQVKLVPVLLGAGIRLFGELAAGPVELENPTVIEGNGVTHLSYAVSGGGP